MAKLVCGSRELALTKSAARGGALPKRGSGKVELVVNGNPAVGIVTSNAAWCGDPNLTLEYIWIEVEPGKALYATLDYAERASDWNGAEVTIAEGAGPKPKPRVTGTAERGLVEFGRETKFRETWAKRA